MKATLVSRTGFTLIELMIVVTIVGVLASVAMLSYRHFTKKAQSVEAEVALTEIHRLQQLHHAQSGSFAGDFGAIGFNPIPPLKFYSVGMRFLGGTDGIAYQAYAYAKGDSDGSTTLVLTQYQDGHVT
ncbi:MAG: prepilin-type N-terminal cleavage/methylation domain-containing protein, partial [Nitrospira sp.]|nr:prepilin-type N-terminal cleavage/methylation domain-containing protein [Nitrospira sp.]